MHPCPSDALQSHIVETRGNYSRRCEALACRLILAHLLDDAADRAAAAWQIQSDAAMPFGRFQPVNQTAQVAAEYWREMGQVDTARRRLTERLRQLS